MSSRNVIVVAVLAFVMVLAGGAIYVSSLHGTLVTAQTQLAASKQEAQKWKASYDQAQKLAADNAAARDKYKSDADAAGAKVTAMTAELDQSHKQLASLQTRLAATRHTTAEAKQVSAYWRALYDYTKTEPQPAIAENKADSKANATAENKEPVAGDTAQKSSQR